MNFKIVPGERKNNLVIYENEKFFKTKFIQSLSAYKWKCIKKKCNAKIYIDENLTEILKYDVQHTNHEKSKFKTKLFSNQPKRKLGECMGNTSKIVNREKLNDIQIPEDDVFNVKQYVHRERKKHILSLSKNHVEVSAKPTTNLEVKLVQGESLLILEYLLSRVWSIQVYAFLFIPTDHRHKRITGIIYIIIGLYNVL